MQFKEFRDSLSAATPPAQLSTHLRSLWYDAKGDWHTAHEIIQEMEDENGAWIHAYLHRKEGDIGNADYWYHKAGKTRTGVSLQDEWNDITRALLA